MARTRVMYGYKKRRPAISGTGLQQPQTTNGKVCATKTHLLVVWFARFLVRGCSSYRKIEQMKKCVPAMRNTRAKVEIYFNRRKIFQKKFYFDNIFIINPK